jgi:hypothetical protein
MRFFSQILLNLQARVDTPMRRSQSYEQWNIVIYYLVKKDQLATFKINGVEDRGVLSQFDARWKNNKEEDLVRICAIKSHQMKFE